MHWLMMARWSPYVAGTGIGLLACTAFLFLDRPLGCSMAFARTSGMIEKLLRGPKVLQKAFYRKFPPAVDWEWMLVVGIVVGAFISSALSGQLKATWVPERWAQAFGPSAIVRVGAALLGGIFVGFGARWAGGCTSGHGISGTLQLAVSSWIAVLCFFAGGIATAMLIFRLAHS